MDICPFSRVRGICIRCERCQVGWCGSAGHFLGFRHRPGLRDLLWRACGTEGGDGSTSCLCNFHMGTLSAGWNWKLLLWCHLWRLEWNCCTGIATIWALRWTLPAGCPWLPCRASKAEHLAAKSYQVATDPSLSSWWVGSTCNSYYCTLYSLLSFSKHTQTFPVYVDSQWFTYGSGSIPSLDRYQLRDSFVFVCIFARSSLYPTLWISNSLTHTQMIPCHTVWVIFVEGSSCYFASTAIPHFGSLNLISLPARLPSLLQITSHFGSHFAPETLNSCW